MNDGRPLQNLKLSRELAYTGGRDKECWQNAIIGGLVYLSKFPDAEVSYVEGWAYNELPLQHAWLIVDGEIVDPTPIWAFGVTRSERDELQDAVFGLPAPEQIYFAGQSWILDDLLAELAIETDAGISLPMPVTQETESWYEGDFRSALAGAFNACYGYKPDDDDLDRYQAGYELFGMMEGLVEEMGLDPFAVMLQVLSTTMGRPHVIAEADEEG